MKSFNEMTMKSKLIVFFLIAGLVPLALVGTWSSLKASNALMKSTFAQLEGVREIKKTQVETYFGERQGDMGVLLETVATLRQEAFAKLTAIQASKQAQIERFFAERQGDALVLADNPFVHQAFKALDAAFDVAGGATGGQFKGLTGEKYTAPASYRAVHDRYFPTFKYYMEQYGYYDIFLMDAGNGDTSFTVTKESDFGQRAREVTSSLRDVWQIAVQEGRVALSDTKPYEPSAGAPAQFVAAPIKENGRVIGVVALQISIDGITTIMSERSGMGETGEAYLVGPDLLMRSDSYLDPENHTVTASFADPVKGAADTEAVRKALAGVEEQDVIIDYNGNPVLSAYAPLQIGDITWALLAEIDVAEAFSPKDEAGEYFFNKYVQMYGYYDLFLINPDGYVFYTAAQESDYQTNMVDGEYSGSGLGKLVRNVLDSKSFGFADFEPYAPSNDEPAAFIAQPYVHNGEAEIIVALQLSLEGINNIMQERTGMGETGETYLVGSDKLMRSDSYLDQVNHTVMASFANPAKGSVDTEGSNAALAGDAGNEIIIDYNGNPVLSAYTPLDVFGTRWALLAEIDNAEVKQPVNALVISIVILAALMVAAVVFLALFITGSILKLLGKDPAIISNVARSIAEGDLTIEFDQDRKSNRGVYAAMKEMTGKLQAIISSVQVAGGNVSSGSQQLSSSAQQLSAGATEQAASVEEVSASVEQMNSNIKQNADNSAQTEKMALKAAQDAKESGTAVSEAMAAMKSIAEKISIIEEIARQTNLLALNAAIEAARAGEHGKGFAVVASEVRKLAERSQTAAGEISGLSASSVEVAERAGELIAQLVPDIQKTADLVQEISAASAEQTSGAEQINKAIAQLDQVIQQNASASEEMAATSEELSSQADQMQENMRFFRLKENGSGLVRMLPEPGAAVETKVSGDKGDGNGNSHQAGGLVSREVGDAQPQETAAVGASAGDPEDDAFEEY